MVVCTLEPIQLDEGVEIVSVDWLISKNTSFTPLELSSIGDKNNKDMIIFNEVLDTNIKWYGRARLLLSTGHTVWGNIEVFNSVNVDDAVVVKDMPSRLAVPLVSTNSNQNFHDLTLFTISAEGYTSIGNAALESVTYIIEDVQGNAIWSSIKNSVYKDGIVVKDIILKSNMIYRIKAMFHSSSGDNSPLGVYTIRTIENEEIYLQTYLDAVNPNEDIELSINGIDGVTSVTWEVISFADDIAFTFWNSKTDNTTKDIFKTTIPKGTLVTGGIYILKISTNLNSIGNKFIPFNCIYNKDDVIKPEVITTNLEIEPMNLEIQVEQTKELKVTTNAKELLYELPFEGKDYISFDPVTKQVVGKKETQLYVRDHGPYFLKLMAQVENTRRVTKLVEVTVNPKMLQYIKMTFRPNGGFGFANYVTGEGKDPIYNYHQELVGEFTIPENKYIPLPGKRFKVFNTQRDGKGEDWIPGEIKESKKPITTNLYPVWEIAPTYFTQELEFTTELTSEAYVDYFQVGGSIVEQGTDTMGEILSINGKSCIVKLNNNKGFNKSGFMCVCVNETMGVVVDQDDKKNVTVELLPKYATVAFKAKAQVAISGISPYTINAVQPLAEQEQILTFGSNIKNIMGRVVQSGKLKTYDLSQVILHKPIEVKYEPPKENPLPTEVKDTDLIANPNTNKEYTRKVGNIQLTIQNVEQVVEYNKIQYPVLTTNTEYTSNILVYEAGVAVPSKELPVKVKTEGIVLYGKDTPTEGSTTEVIANDPEGDTTHSLKIKSTKDLWYRDGAFSITFNDEVFNAELYSKGTVTTPPSQ